MSDVPDDFGDQLARLYPGVVMVVPIDILQSWFPPTVPCREMDKIEIAAAEAFAARFGVFSTISPLVGLEQGDGRFRKA